MKMNVTLRKGPRVSSHISLSQSLVFVWLGYRQLEGVAEVLLLVH